jgi:hypothetical protein
MIRCTLMFSISYSFSLPVEDAAVAGVWDNRRVGFYAQGRRLRRVHPTECGAT